MSDALSRVFSSNCPMKGGVSVADVNADECRAEHKHVVSFLDAAARPHKDSVFFMWR
jgi:hypothetical protein